MCLVRSTIVLVIPLLEIYLVRCRCGEHTYEQTHTQKKNAVHERVMRCTPQKRSNRSICRMRVVCTNTLERANNIHSNNSNKNTDTQFCVCDAKDAGNENSLRFNALTEARFRCQHTLHSERQIFEWILRLANAHHDYYSSSNSVRLSDSFSYSQSRWGAVGCFATATNNYKCGIFLTQPVVNDNSAFLLRQ